MNNTNTPNEPQRRLTLNENTNIGAPGTLHTSVTISDRLPFCTKCQRSAHSLRFGRLSKAQAGLFRQKEASHSGANSERAILGAELLGHIRVYHISRVLLWGRPMEKTNGLQGLRR